MLQSYDWPGNVRELKNAIERAIILTRPDTVIRASALAFLPQAGSTETVLRFPSEPTLEDIERHYFHEIMRRYAGNRQKTAAALGISERHVYRLIEKYRGGEG